MVPNCAGITYISSSYCFQKLESSCKLGTIVFSSSTMKMLARRTAWNVSVFGVILVRIFPHSNWIRRDNLCLSVFSLNAENADQNNSDYWHFSRSEEDLVHNFSSYALSQEELDVLSYELDYHILTKAKKNAVLTEFEHFFQKLLKTFSISRKMNLRRLELDS